ncbi:MAG TPA: hypothetical protein DCZ91_14160 [Lachnospiraceae bacterium]|nr:hypothetical protein [Lachnospiraceae bacterium]
MRLWQKIFLLTLLLTLLAVNTASFVLLTRNQANSLVLAKEKAQTICSSVVSELERAIQREKEQSGHFLLTDQELSQLLWAEIELSAWEQEITVAPVRFSEDAKITQTRLISSGQRNNLIQVSTTAFWEGRFFRVTVSSDVSELFAQFAEDMVFSQWFGGAIALIIAVALLVASLVLTKPLKRLEAATKQIADGAYQERIQVKGYDEIAELSRHMNAMSEEIEEHVNHMEQILKSREIFIANMTHELKTPLTSILGFADILTIKSHVSEEERREYAAIIATEARRLRVLSSKLMELISLQETALDLQQVDLQELIGRAVETFLPVYTERQCQVQTDVPGVKISADSALFTSLVLNLLDNALKASSSGQTVTICGEEKGGNVILQVRDHGIGIPQEQLAHVTEAFFMVDKARSRSAGGAGIGLSLCKAIVEAHHGTFGITSKESCGTTVWITVPIAKGGIVE